ncbi:ABC transporter substrate-binding protein [Cohnella zeiphila]|uniref:Extracellular solute-binding protein n=1 Tax=Cohnella zeiphila TaxID=2761120 RepID=A0A7X0SKV4_9BACL|nr:extracellular solute-binding protein [Cohnella zeiphila]MBB6730679.1 extracellular solute-binding protein [Cohnella zeiphila]
MKKATMLALGASAAMLALSGCGAGSDGNASQGGGSDSGQASSKPAVKLTLEDRLLETSTDGSVIAHRQMIDEFKKENPNVEISEESLQDATYKTKIKTLAAGNDLPDVFELLGSDAKMFSDNKLILPLDDIMNQAPDWKKGFIPSTLNDFTVDGKLVGAPMQMLSTSLIFYNKDIFDKAGIAEFPKTWKEFTDAIQTLKAKGYIPISLGNKDKWVAESCILSELGDRFTGTDWFDSIKDRKGAKFTDRPFVDSLAALQELSKIGAFNADMNSIDNNQQRASYYNGKAAMFFEGDWAISSLSSEAPQEIKDQTHLAILPTADGGAGKANVVSGGAAWAFAINANLKGDKLQAAIDLVKKLTGEEEANVAAENNAVAATVPTDYDKSKVVPLFNEYLEMFKSLELSPIYDGQLSPAIIETMNNGLQDLLIQRVTPEQLAKDIQSTYEGT